MLHSKTDTSTVYVRVDASRHLPVEKTIGPIESDSHVDSQGSLEFRGWTTKSPSVGAKERRERPGLFLEGRRRKHGRSWSSSCIDNSFFIVSFLSIPLFIFFTLFLSLVSSLYIFGLFLLSPVRFVLSFFAREMSLRVRSAAPSWVATITAVPGSTTRTNIKPETAIRWPEYGSSPRTSSYAGDACVAFKPTPKPTPT